MDSSEPALRKYLISPDGFRKLSNFLHRVHASCPTPRNEKILGSPSFPLPRRTLHDIQVKGREKFRAVQRFSSSGRMMRAARAGARLFRPACNLARAGGALGRSAAQPSSRVFSVAAYASPSTFLEKAEVVDRVTGLLRSSPSIDPAKVTPTANLEKDLQMDMLDSVEVMMAVEEEFAIDIPNSEADKISTVAQLIDYIASHPQAK